MADTIIIFDNIDFIDSIYINNSILYYNNQRICQFEPSYYTKTHIFNVIHQAKYISRTLPFDTIFIGMRKENDKYYLI